MLILIVVPVARVKGKLDSFEPSNKNCLRHYCTYTDTQGYKLEKCEISRAGFSFKNGECCCHGCLRKNQRRNNWCQKRTTRAGNPSPLIPSPLICRAYVLGILANHPRYQPLDEQCLVEERNCTCTNENKSKQLKLKDTKPKPLNEIREKMKLAKEDYEKNKAYHQRDCSILITISL